MTKQFLSSKKNNCILVTHPWSRFIDSSSYRNMYIVIQSWIALISIFQRWYRHNYPRNRFCSLTNITNKKSNLNYLNFCYFPCSPAIVIIQILKLVQIKCMIAIYKILKFTRICISIYTLLVCLSVLYPINVKTAEPIGPKFFVWPHINPRKGL